MESQNMQNPLNLKNSNNNTGNIQAIPLTDIDKEFDINAHAVIEASAGTGKTYTIENITMRLIRAGIDLEKILIVTFTEKATGELKDRIRKEIEMHADEEAIFRKALDSFENARISTIHGFCHRVLKENAFENRGYFKFEIVDDQEVYQRTLRQQMRKDWPERFGEALADKLINHRVTESWAGNVTRLANKWTPEAGEYLYPSEDEIAEKMMEFRQDLVGISKIVGDIDPDRFEDNAFYQAYGRLVFVNEMGDPISKFETDRLQKVIKPVLAMVIDARQAGLLDQKEDLEKGLLPLYKRFNEHRLNFNKGKNFGEFKEIGFCCLITCSEKYTKNKKYNTVSCDNVESVCPHLVDLINLLERLSCIDAYSDIDTDRFKRDAVERLRPEALAYKEQNGLISYDDMLVKLQAALDDSQNPNASRLLDDLRAKYRCALVDEFQDTDAVQWDIFKTIFVDASEQTQNRLIVVGDPKQAIYSFRGADVHIYLKAKKHLLKNAGAKLYNLPFNWRSTPALIECLNPVFQSPFWFGDGQNSAPDRIGYWDVTPPKNNRRACLYQDNTGSKPLVLMPDNDEKSLPHYIAKRILELLKPGMLYFRDNNADSSGRGRFLRANDICVLVRSRFEALKVEKALHKHEIPYTYYKKEGIFESEESLHLCYLLKAIAEPDKMEAFKKMLLTRFFNIPPERLAAYEDLSHKHPIRKIFQNWQELSQKRMWPQFFKAVFDDTGILYRESTLHDGDRRITNYKHIVQEIESAAHLNNMDIAGLADYLFKLKAKVIKLGDKADLHQLETEKPKVQIMTMHAAKGLEYPVVFLAGGYKKLQIDADGKVHHPETQSVLYDLLGEFAEVHKQEALDESRRLYYVALTRAIYKLYIPFEPWLPGEDEMPFPVPEDLSQRLDGPVSGFLSRSIEDAYGVDDPQTKMPEAALEVSPSGDCPVDSDDVADQLENKYDFDRLKKFKINQRFYVAHRLNAVDSYKTLKPVAQGAVPIEFAGINVPSHYYAGETPETNDDETDEMDQMDIHDTGDASLALPKGRKTGDFIHDILENVDFLEVGRAKDAETLLQESMETRAVIQKYLNKYRFSGVDENGNNPFKIVAARMVWKALHHPLSPDGFKLGNLEPGDRLPELEFYYSLPHVPDSRQTDGHGFNQDAVVNIPDVKFHRKGYLTGKIDLVFKRGSYVYILDWKTNTLPDGYHAASVAAAMEKENYHLQYQLYALAVNRWIEQSARSSALEFKGVYYLFLRGLDPRSLEKGVFFYQPGTSDLENYQKQLVALVGLKQGRAPL